MRAYDWPGNVRELMAVIEHACIVCEGGRLLPCHLPPELLEVAAEPTDADADDRNGDSSRRYQAPNPDEEKQQIRAALEEAEGNRTRAAAALGMGRTTLWQKLKAYGLDAA
jgi:transcriptional regulator of acetoin/glycerol metabolism